MRTAHDFQMYPCDSCGEELCPVCGIYRLAGQPEDCWQFHMSICASIADREDTQRMIDPDADWL